MTIHSDELFIERILQNLISNAIKFFESDTDIKIGSRLTEHALTFYVQSELGKGSVFTCALPL